MERWKAAIRRVEATNERLRGGADPSAEDERIVREADKAFAKVRQTAPVLQEIVESWTNFARWLSPWVSCRLLFRRWA